jgi:multiple sugar transport system permease protein
LSRFERSLFSDSRLSTIGWSGRNISTASLLGGEATETLPVSIPKLITSQGVRWGEMAVVGITALAPVLTAVFLLQRHIVRGLTLGAVKG